MPILSDEKEALIKKRIKELEDENNRNLYPLISLYSDVFKNTPKALALYKKLADINFYDKILLQIRLLYILLPLVLLLLYLHYLPMHLNCSNMPIQTRI